ncbi:hypothetical protein [Virgibacillus doumboii]|uniref:hypothetical protein n=1 Tax=Virgibacillus doumboii TaxID=2697503 RepID=UPI0013E0B5FA|nr:hypothetical protein [Virgibacillus doumboii]
MNILNLGVLYENWLNENKEASQTDKLIVRTLLATKDAAATIFITEASFDHLTKVYNDIKEINTKPIDHVDYLLSEKPNEYLLNEETAKNSNEPNKRLDRRKAINFVINNLKANNEGLGIIRIRYNTLHLKLQDGRDAKLKISTSRDYKGEMDEPNKICCSWHKEDDRKIQQYDFHVYIAEWKDTYKALFFTTKQLERHQNQKSYNNHFVNYYFHWESNGCVVDYRDTPFPIDVTKRDVVKNSWILS